MRIMVLGAADAAAELALQLADSQGIAPISAGGRLSGGDGEQPVPSLEQELEGEFVLRDGPATPEQAAAFDSLLDALDAPLELVIGIDTTQEAPANLSADPPTGTDPLLEYYRERGLLRRIRGEGEAADILAAANRIIDDLARARHPEQEDRFATALRAIARESVPTVSDDTAAPVASEVKESAVSEPETVSPSNRYVPNWKRSAAPKGRLQRQPASGKGKRKPRR